MIPFNAHPPLKPIGYINYWSWLTRITLHSGWLEVEIFIIFLVTLLECFVAMTVAWAFSEPLNQQLIPPASIWMQSSELQEPTMWQRWWLLSLFNYFIITSAKMRGHKHRMHIWHYCDPSAGVPIKTIVVISFNVNDGDKTIRADKHGHDHDSPLHTITLSPWLKKESVSSNSPIQKKHNPSYNFALKKGIKPDKYSKSSLWFILTIWKRGDSGVSCSSHILIDNQQTKNLEPNHIPLLLFTMWSHCNPPLASESTDKSQ